MKWIFKQMDSIDKNEIKVVGWVDIKEKKPEKLERCIFICESINNSYDGEIFIGTYTGRPDSDIDCRQREFSIIGITLLGTHWMPVSSIVSIFEKPN